MADDCHYLEKYDLCTTEDEPDFLTFYLLCVT